MIAQFEVMTLEDIYCWCSLLETMKTQKRKEMNQ